MMDAAQRSELDALRERAYGPDADILNDPAALARLEVLEDEVRGADDVDEAVGADDQIEPPSPDGAPRRARRPLVVGLVAGSLAVAAVVAGLIVAPLLTPAAEPEASPTPTVASDFESLTGFERLIRIGLDGSFARSSPLPSTPIPVLSDIGTIQWAEPLGEYYGFDLWIGGVVAPDGEGLCLVASVEGGASDAACRPHAQWGREGILLLMPFTTIEPAERPDGLGPGDSLGFWWVPDDAVLVLRGSAPPG